MAKTRKTTAGRKRVKFEYRATSESAVFVAGTFNEWRPDHKALKAKEGEGVFSATMMLPKGTHEYKFVVNDTWCADPDCNEWVPNDFGGINSVVTVG